MCVCVCLFVCLFVFSIDFHFKKFFEIINQVFSFSVRSKKKVFQHAVSNNSKNLGFFRIIGHCTLKNLVFQLINQVFREKVGFSIDKLGFLSYRTCHTRIVISIIRVDEWVVGK